MGKLKAAASEIDITPPVGTYLTGYGTRIEPAKSIHDPLMAHGVLLNDGKTKFIIISCDLLGFDTISVAEMRQAISRRISVPAQNILISCTHTHSGPATAKFRGPMGHINQKWLEKIKGKIVEMTAGLQSRLQQAKLGYASRQVTGVGFNRQDKSRSIDEELTTISIENQDGMSIATLMNYATHAVVLGMNLEISGDFPGEACRHLQKIRGGIAFYLQGASGDAEPLSQIEFGWGKGGYPTTKRLGELLAKEANESLKTTTMTDEVNIRVVSRVIDLPLEAPPSMEEFLKLKSHYEMELNKAVRENKPTDKELYKGFLEWAADMEKHLKTNTVPRELPSEVFIAAINDLRITAIPFEPYSDIAIELKRRIKPLKAFLAGYSNGLHGYIAPVWAKQQGGYGPGDSCRWFPALLTPVAAGADEMLIVEAVRLASSI